MNVRKNRPVHRDAYWLLAERNDQRNNVRKENGGGNTSEGMDWRVEGGVWNSRSPLETQLDEYS